MRHALFAQIRESFDDILAVLKLPVADKPSRIFGLQIDASKLSFAFALVINLTFVCFVDGRMLLPALPLSQSEISSSDSLRTRSRHKKTYPPSCEVDSKVSISLEHETHQRDNGGRRGTQLGPPGAALAHQSRQKHATHGIVDKGRKREAVVVQSSGVECRDGRRLGEDRVRSTEIATASGIDLDSSRKVRSNAARRIGSRAVRVAKQRSLVRWLGQGCHRFIQSCQAVPRIGQLVKVRVTIQLTERKMPAIHHLN